MLMIYIINTMKESEDYYKAFFREFDIKGNFQILQIAEDKDFSVSESGLTKYFLNQFELYDYLDRVINKNKKNIDNIRIVGTDEFDVDNLGFFREEYGIYGKKYEDSVLFRDKYRMKKQINFPSSDFHKIKSIAELVHMKNIKEKIVIKPLCGVSSKDVFVVQNNSEINDAMLNRNISDVLVEQYQEGGMFHTDGVVMRDTRRIICFASEYINNGLAYKENKPISSVTLDYNSSLSSRLIKATELLLKQFPSSESYVFHAEWFVRGEDIVFNEVASRFGGGLICRCLRKKYGIDLVKLHLLSQIRDVDDRDIKLNESSTISGWIYVPQGENKEIESFLEQDIPSHINIISEKHHKKKGVQRKLSRSVDYISAYEIVQDSIRETRECLIKLAEITEKTINYKKNDKEK